MFTRSLRTKPVLGVEIFRCLSNLKSTAGKSLDANLIASDPTFVIEQLKRRNMESILSDKIDRVHTLKGDRSHFISIGESSRNMRKTLSKNIGVLMKNNSTEEVERLKLKVEQHNMIADSADQKLESIEKELNDIVSHFPNFLDDSVPDGESDVDNKVISAWGEDKCKIGDNFLWHDEIAKHLNGFENEAAVRVAGSRFSVLTGSLARLERALIQFFLDFHVGRGYLEVAVPYIVSRAALEGTGQLPKFEEDLFKINHPISGHDAFLIPTAEVPLTNLFREQIIKHSQLPIYLVAHTPSFRAEVGNSGKDTRGLLRQHQFHKVELVKIVSPETSEAEHEALTEDAQTLLRLLDLPHRKLLLCGGDTGFSARKCYDLEVWLPGQQAYREISSCSNCHDFQSRRMSLRYKEPVEGKTNKTVTRHPHTLNGSGLAVGRTLAAILENYQQADGSVRIPDVLKPYMGGGDLLEVNKKVIF